MKKKDYIDLSKHIKKVESINPVKRYGKVKQVIGLTIESHGPSLEIGQLCCIKRFDKKEDILAEVVGFKDDRLVLMPLGSMEGIGSGSEVVDKGEKFKLPVGNKLLGRILDGLGRPMDGKGPVEAEDYYPVINNPPHPLKREKIREVISLGIKAVDGLITCGKGQRMGIFSGSGVGKSTLLGMIARNAEVDVNVIALIGERGREVREFIEDDLGEEGLKKSVVIVATSDKPALIRTKGAFVATAIAEYFREKGKDVLLLMDSLTRFAMAQREVGLAAGEPPVARGYTPSVFAVLPKLLERTGTSNRGSITGLYSVLVDGDDLDEPISDSVRGNQDGHIVLSRSLANKNHYPAIDVLKSVSRLMPDIVTQQHMEAASNIKKILAQYNEAEDLINIGAYSKGSNKDIDYAIEKIDLINDFLRQKTKQKVSFDETLDKMFSILQ
jgi:flagellum-specific ATP synthase